MSSSPLAAASAGSRRRSAEAVLSDWEGHFAVERCCANSAIFNGYTAAVVANANRSRRHRIDISDADNDEEDHEEVNVDRETSIITTLEHRNSRRGRRRNEALYAEHYSSPNRSSISGGGSGGDGGGGVTSGRLSSRLGLHSRQRTMGSSLLGDSMTEIVIEDLQNIQNESEPTSALLDYCKRKFLRPYVLILALVGLNPISTDTTLCRACISYLQALFVFVLLLSGYLLQYVCSYRGDRGFANYHKVLPSAGVARMTSTHEGAVRTIGELLFGYVIPNTLHLLGFVSAVIVCKIVGQEQLQTLIERVFLVSMKPRRLCRCLWLHVVGGFVLLCLLIAYVMPAVLMQPQIIQVEWIANVLRNWQLPAKITLLAGIFVQDLVEIVILSSYCIECYLLRVHLATLSHKLLMHSIESLDWMREVLEFRKLLDHLNQRVAVPVCFFIIMNLAYAFAGFVYLFNDFDFHYSALKVVLLNIINVLLWLFMGLVPFFIAASLTRVCQSAQANGHHIRVRPFVYQNASADDLNSTLLFASSLDMSAKLFRMPIQPNYLCFAILVVSIVILTLGMCLNLTALGAF